MEKVLRWPRRGGRAEKNNNSKNGWQVRVAGKRQHSPTRPRMELSALPLPTLPGCRDERWVGMKTDLGGEERERTGVGGAGDSRAAFEGEAPKDRCKTDGGQLSSVAPRQEIRRMKSD